MWPGVDSLSRHVKMLFGEDAQLLRMEDSHKIIVGNSTNTPGMIIKYTGEIPPTFVEVASAGP